MLFDPISAVVIAGAIGVSSLVRNRDDQILKMFESRMTTTLSQPYRIVVEHTNGKLAESSMVLSEEI